MPATDNSTRMQLEPRPASWKGYLSSQLKVGVQVMDLAWVHSLLFVKPPYGDNYRGVSNVRQAKVGDRGNEWIR